MNEIIWGRYSLLVYTGIATACFFIASFHSIFFLLFFVAFIALIFISNQRFFTKKDLYYQTFHYLGDFVFFLKALDQSLDSIIGNQMMTRFHTLEIKGVWFIREQKYWWS